MPRVSIITPMHNAADRVEQAIRSVQDQTMSDYEHIVVDNMSTDDGAKIVADLASEDPRFRHLSPKA